MLFSVPTCNPFVYLGLMFCGSKARLIVTQPYDAQHVKKQENHDVQDLQKINKK